MNMASVDELITMLNEGTNMPTPVADNSIWLYTQWYTGFGQRFLNTSYYAMAPTAPVVDYENEGDDFLTFMEAGGNLVMKTLDCISSAITLEKITMQPVNPQRFMAIEETVGLPGNVGGDPLPVNIASVITRRSVEATRKGIGSWHLPTAGIDTLDAATNEWLGAHITNLEEVADLLATEIVTGAVNPVTWTPVLVTPTEAGSWERRIIIAAFSQANPRVMRRRTLRLGI